MMRRTFCSGKPLRLRAEIPAISVMSSAEYRRRRPSRLGTTMPRSSHHCSCRGVMPVSLTTCADVNCCSTDIALRKCFKHFPFKCLHYFRIGIKNVNGIVGLDAAGSDAAADEVHDLQLVAVFKASRIPIAARNDL